jgi:hypothetical protein
VRFFNLLVSYVISILIILIGLIFFVMTPLVLLLYIPYQLILFRILKLQSYSVKGYEEGQRQRIEKISSTGPFVYTSGTSNKPKKIFMPKARLFITKVQFSLSMINILFKNITNKTFFILGSFNSENSLSDYMMKETKLVSRFALIQAPYRLLSHPFIIKIHHKYSHNAIRAWIFWVSQPRYLYATNPSSLCNFHQSLKEDETLN